MGRDSELEEINECRCNELKLSLYHLSVEFQIDRLVRVNLDCLSLQNFVPLKLLLNTKRLIHGDKLNVQLRILLIVLLLFNFLSFF